MAFFILSLKKILSKSEAANHFEIKKHLITQRIHVYTPKGIQKLYSCSCFAPFLCQSAVSGIIDDAVTLTSCLFFCLSTLIRYHHHIVRKTTGRNLEQKNGTSNMAKLFYAERFSYYHVLKKIPGSVLVLNFLAQASKTCFARPEEEKSLKNSTDAFAASARSYYLSSSSKPQR